MLDIPRIRKEFEKNGYDVNDCTNGEIEACAGTITGRIIQLKMAFEDFGRTFYKELTGKEWMFRGSDDE